LAQKTVIQKISRANKGDKYSHGGSLLGPILCWAVVFADIGTSVYYTPGILYSTVGKQAGFFVFLTMVVFVLLTLKYAEVTHRFPQGGGVVTVAAQAINHWFGALGGMFILVDYFLTAAISCLSGMLYLSVVMPALGHFALEVTIVVLILLGILNWVGISESARVSFVGAVVAFLSDLAILFTVFTHISFADFLALIPKMFAGHVLTPISILIGFSSSFLAFSGLESISQLSPVMKTPRKKVAGMALLLVVLTIGLTSPLLTMLSTLLLPSRVLDDSVLSAQVISLLAGYWGNIILQTEVAISAGALLVFASNTAIIGSYHVFIALSRMEFFPAFVLQRNKLRGTPHYSILLATAIPIAVLIIVNGNINLLGDMYAFGLLGAFSLTCLGLDLVRYRERRNAWAEKHHATAQYAIHQNNPAAANRALQGITSSEPESTALSGNQPQSGSGGGESLADETPPSPYAGPRILNPWYTFKFYIGILTTFLVLIAWTTNLVAKPLATLFGGTVTVAGMGVAYVNYARHRRRGHAPVVVTHVETHLPGSILAILTPNNPHNNAVIRTVISNAEGRPVVFLYEAEPSPSRVPRMFEYVEPYHEDQQAKEYFGRAEHEARKTKIPRWFLYRQRKPGDIGYVWRVIRPRDTVVAAENVPLLEDINPDLVRYELTPEGKVAHLLKQW
jgi:amino acid transporter